MGESAKILVVDDDPDLLSLTSFILDKAGYQVLVASNGESSFQVAKKERPDLVLLDVVLPDVSGIDVCRQIKQDRDLAGTYVILLSGIKTSSDAQADGLVAGADSYIVRPIPNRELLARIEAMIRIKRSESEIKAQKEWFRVTLSSIRDAVIATDRKGTVTFLNPVAQSLTGWSQAEVEGKPLDSFCRIIDAKTGLPVESPVQRVLDEGSPLEPSRDNLLIDREGREIFVEYSGAPTRDDEGNIIGMVLVFRDITERKRAEEALSWEIKVNAAIAELSSILLSPVSIGEISAFILEHAKRLTDSPLGFVGYMDPQSGKLIYFATSGPEPRSAGDYPDEKFENVLDSLPSPLDWVISHKKPLLDNQVHQELVFPGSVHPAARIYRILSVPALIEDKVVGLITLANGERNYTEQDFELVDRLSALYAIAIQRKLAEEELRSLSLVDELTGLYNRRGFLTLAKQQLKVANRMKKSMLVLFIDLDNMKLINDSLGHHEGDLALIDTANILRDTFRESDIIARMGGDEFVVLALETTEYDAQAIIDRLNEQFARHNRRGIHPYELSISFGIERYDPSSPCSIEELLMKADKKMYEQKRSKQESKR